MAKAYYVYVLACADGTLYTGYSTDVAARLAKHNAGLGAKYTKPKTRRPCQLLYQETYDSKSAALAGEYAFKQLSRASKIKYLNERGVAFP